MRRMVSGWALFSILITSAPKVASHSVASGAVITQPKSATRMPSNGSLAITLCSLLGARSRRCGASAPAPQLNSRARRRVRAHHRRASLWPRDVDELPTPGHRALEQPHKRRCRREPAADKVGLIAWPLEGWLRFAVSDAPA